MQSKNNSIQHHHEGEAEEAEVGDGEDDDVRAEREEVNAYFGGRDFDRTVAVHNIRKEYGEFAKAK